MDRSTRQALHVPSVDVGASAERLSVLLWLQNQLLADQVAWGLPDTTALANDFAAARLHHLATFWEEEGPTALTDRVAELLGALGRAGHRILVVVSRHGSRLDWTIATDAADGSVASVLRAALPGAGVESGRHDPSRLEQLLSRRGRLALVGVPSRQPAPRQQPLLERLAVTDVDIWTLVVHARPVLPADLAERYRQLVGLRAQLAAYARTTRVMSETESREELDPVADLAADLLKREERRSLRFGQFAGLATEAWLVGDEPDMASLGAVAGSVLAADGLATPRPLRVLQEGGRQGAATLLLPEELAGLVQPPVHDLRGFKVRRWVRFDVEPERPGAVSGPTLRLGTTATGDAIDHPIDAFTSHALITGATGSGKSSLVRSLLGQLARPDVSIPFLVIEPTKDEYATLPMQNLRVWRIGDGARPPWHLNPLEVPSGIPLQTHIDLLISLFASTFALFPPLPYLVEMGLRRVYADRGWDLVSGRNARAEVDPDYPAFPTLRELLATCLDLVEELGYQGEVLHNVRGALQARLGSLLEGPKGAVIDTDERLDVAGLLGGPCVVNLDLIGSDPEKAFFMGLLLIRLWEARRGRRSRALRHLTVLEEAHRIMPAPAPRSGDGMGPSGDFAAETFGNLLAEVRAAGEGILIAEQSPSTLAAGAIANTGLKICLRTMAAQDRDLLAASLNLDEAQQRALTGLAPHDALTFWAGMTAPVRMQAEAEFAPEAAPQVVGPTSAARPVVVDPAIPRLADLLLRVGRAEVGPVRDELWGRVGRALPEELADRVDDVVEDAVAQAAERIGRSRTLPRRTRREMVGAALADPPAGTLLPSSPERCSCARPANVAMCRLREPVVAAVTAWEREGRRPAEVADFLASAEVVAHLRMRLQEACGTDRDLQSLDDAIRCMARRTLRGTRPDAEIRAFVRDLPVGRA